MTKPRVTSRKPLERDVQRQIVHLFDLAGCVTYRTDQGYRADPGGTRMTPGLADLLVFLPWAAMARLELIGRIGTYELVNALGIGFFEVKTPDGLKLHHRNLAKRERRAVAQDRFGTLCRERGIPYAMGHIEQAWQFLASVGLARMTPPLSPHAPDANPQWTLTPRRP